MKALLSKYWELDHVTGYRKPCTLHDPISIGDMLLFLSGLNIDARRSGKTYYADVTELKQAMILEDL